MKKEVSSVLNKDEELKLASLVGVIENDTAEGINYVCNEQTVKWLTEKLKEVNNECFRYAAELQKTNEKLARVYEVYGP